ncbi:MAG TPA: hypothetical protein VEY09_16410 [Pyrinomonadaceae bacterium]|nr:hypothetical protein [Pyrinomonadaceae bacterium]
MKEQQCERQFVRNRGQPNNSLNPTANSGTFVENISLIAVVRGGLSQALGALMAKLHPTKKKRSRLGWLMKLCY